MPQEHLRDSYRRSTVEERTRAAIPARCNALCGRMAKAAILSLEALFFGIMWKQMCGYT